MKSTGFVGRRSLDFVLPELPVSDAVKFWGEAAARRSTREILDTLAVTGGGVVPLTSRHIEKYEMSDPQSVSAWMNGWLGIRFPLFI